MILPCYPLSSDESLTIFEFTSEGPNGKITKIVQYAPTNLKDVFNLAFGDKDHQTGEIDDPTISNNGDSEKVLATVVATVYAFTDKNPEVWVYASGSTVARNRLYRMGIAKHFHEVQIDFEVYGEVENNWEPFQKEIEYQGFLVKRKNSKFVL